MRPVEKMSPRTTTLSFIRPISFELSTALAGTTRATGFPRLVITTPCGPEMIQDAETFGLKLAGRNGFLLHFHGALMIAYDQSDDQSVHSGGAYVAPFAMYAMSPCHATDTLSWPLPFAKGHEFTRAISESRKARLQPLKVFGFLCALCAKKIFNK